MSLKRVAILGSGGMGTALGVLLAQRGIHVCLWARRPTHAFELRTHRENKRHLPGISFPSGLEVADIAGAICQEADLWIVAIPSAFLRSTLQGLDLPTGTGRVLSVVKGIESETLARPSEIITQMLDPQALAILSGPSHAEEFARGLPASVVVAGHDESFNQQMQEQLNSDKFRVYTNRDALGVELAGALKNVMGIAAGICEGLGFGDNAKAALLTRGLAEIVRFACAQGARADTFYGLAGVGDLLTTCYSPHGRNRSVGLRIGQGESLEHIMNHMNSVAEGVTTTRGVFGLAQQAQVEMPITREVFRILFEGKPPRRALDDLMLRPPKVEGPV
jgi:glycerol-3-phosphate dehydrogenase (NAD(P)+)